MSVVFLDCETTGLDPSVHVPWEVAIIEPDGTEHVWCWRPADVVMEEADLTALGIGRFRERAPLIYDGAFEEQVASQVSGLLEGNVVVGSNPHFDVTMLTAWLDFHHMDWPAHYRPVCAITMAAGLLHGEELAGMTGPLEILEQPWSSYQISQACSIDPPGEAERHTALGDARWVKRLYEHITGTA